jgi:hypothetical protein
MVEFMNELFGGEMNDVAKHMKVSHNQNEKGPDLGYRRKKK